MVYANDFVCGNDNDTLERAIENRGADGVVVIQPRCSELEPERDYWLLDRAVLLPANTTVVLRNCAVKLSDSCRDNFFRSANCGLGIEYPEKTENIHIRGEGTSTLLGADHPRATGDGSKILANPCPYDADEIRKLGKWKPEQWHDYSYGTDAGKEGESPYGDWRGIGILLANAEHFSVENLRIVDSHGWGISLEECAYGRVSRIEFDARMHKMIDGVRSNLENQDGVDLRCGCHHITVSDISGCTGDDIVALTAFADSVYRPGGSLRNTHVMHNDWTKREKDIHDVVIRNVVGYSCHCCMVLLLPVNSSIYNVVIDGIVDSAPPGQPNGCALLLGELDGAYGKNLPDSMRNIMISNVSSGGLHAVNIAGYLTDSVISNVIYRGLSPDGIKYGRPGCAKNVSVTNYVHGCYQAQK
ncbi:MAG: hypothetical protein IJN38_01120 [Clostridia bacterium]|nr:hypothetical protein [Clostridia bacterium]